jgi:hypothetical protein
MSFFQKPPPTFFLCSHNILYQQRFETAPLRGAMVQTVTGNLVEDSSAMRIEIFNGVNNFMKSSQLQKYICSNDSI